MRARDLLGEGAMAVAAAREMRAKHCTAAQLGEQLRRFKAIWPELRERIHAQLLPLPALRRMLQDVGAPTEPEQIGITRQRLRQTYWQASCIRRRFMGLDLVVRAGWLDAFLDEIFGPSGVWPIS